MIRALICAAALTAPVAAFAQNPVTIAAPVDGNVLRAGVKVPVRTLQELTTKKKALKAGDRINVEVAEAVMSGTNVIIPAGTPGMAEITTVRNKGMWGKSGYIEGRVLYLRLGGRQVRLTGTFNDKGVTGTAGVVGAIAFVPVAGFFTTGTSALIPNGTILPAFLDEDLAFTVAPTPAVEPIRATIAAPAETKPVAMVDPSLEVKVK
ncbi:hypothetical protein [Sphingobium sp. CFD-1]|uniref:hypothetical protein n=1 Tax=Sphingobium sp. CFD-1 TaxID=2878545 RepID=UPI00214B1B78|nr:hypothetical protein [Sphingobium sp. CFD-1]